MSEGTATFSPAPGSTPGPAARERNSRRFALAVCLVALGGGAAMVARPPSLAHADPTAKAQPVEMPANVRLGVRAAGVQQQLGVIPTLVLVPDARSYVAAIARWTTTDKGASRFPVLLDKGSHADQQRIARFVRAFRPTSVVRWEAPKGDKVARGPWPVDREKRQSQIDAALASAWGAESTPVLSERWKTLGFTPPGVVLAWGDDPAWTAGLALAAGRGQPLAWIPPRGEGVGGLMLPEHIERLRVDAESACKATGYPFAELGDAIDALTLCHNTPGKILLDPKDGRKMLAVTDVLGRTGSIAPGAAPGKRFAWSGQIVGDESQAAYVAMCALFISRPESAWCFDGYDSSEPWVKYDQSRAGEVLRGAGLDVLVDDAAAGKGLDDWRARIAGTPAGAAKGTDDKSQASPRAGFGVNAGLVTVTTSGNQDFFELKPGIGRSVDVPLLRVPSAVYFVHSWSAYQPDNRTTIGAMWLERGAFAYLGSVHEPYLGAFVPTPLLAQRLLAPIPWGAAARADNAEPWKIAVYGDPLYTLAAPGPRLNDKPPLDGAVDLAGELPTLLKDRSYARALRTLATLGRDEDGARLIGALVRERPAPITRDLLHAGLCCAFFAGQTEVFLSVARELFPIRGRDAEIVRPPSAPEDLEAMDMIWHVVWPSRFALGADAADLLLACLRPTNPLADARDLVTFVQAQRLSAPAPKEIVRRAQTLVKDSATSNELDKLAR